MASRAAERRLTLRMTRPLPRSVDNLLVILSRSADRSVLCGFLAGASALVGSNVSGWTARIPSAYPSTGSLA